MVMGHECAGEIVEAPSGAKYAIGTTVVIFPKFFCGKCKFCKQGKVNLCPDGKVIGSFSFDGAMQEYIAVREPFLIPFGNSVTPEVASMTEPLAVAYHCFKKLTDSEELGQKNIVVIGCGTIGLSILQLLKTITTGRVIAVDPTEHRLEIAKKAGATHTINPRKESLVELIDTITSGSMCDYSFEAVGFSETAKSSIDILGRNGIAFWVGNAQKDVVIDMQKTVISELRIVGSYTYSLEDFVVSLKLLEDGKIDLSSLITHTFDLSDGPAAFETLENNPNGEAVKVILRNEKSESYI